MAVGEKNSSPEQQAAIVTFRLGSQIFALPITPIRQIIEMVTITPIPQANPCVAGVINFHGTMVPVINLHMQLGMTAIQRQLHTPIILVTISERIVGLIVDQVLNVLERPVNEFIEPGNTMLKEMGDISFIHGMLFSPEGPILLLNPEHLLSARDASTLLEAAQKLPQVTEQNRLAEETTSLVAPLAAPEESPAPELPELKLVESELSDPKLPSPELPNSEPAKPAEPAKTKRPRSRKKSGDSRKNGSEAVE